MVLIVRGIAQGVPTAQLARELECDRSELLNLRHRLQDLAFRNRDRMPLDDEVLEADEAYQNAGEKRRAASRSRGPATAPGEQDPRPWHMGERPASGVRDFSSHAYLLSARSIEGFTEMTYGINVARRAWLTPKNIINCMTAKELVKWAKVKR